MNLALQGSLSPKSSSEWAVTVNSSLTKNELLLKKGYDRARNFLSNSLVPSDKYNVYFACPNHKTTCPKIDKWAVLNSFSSLACDSWLIRETIFCNGLFSGLWSFNNLVCQTTWWRVFEWAVKVSLLHIQCTLGCFCQLIQHTSNKWSSTFCLFLLDKQPNRTLSATLVETFLCASFHTFSCYLRFFSFWNEHHC